MLRVKARNPGISGLCRSSIAFLPFFRRHRHLVEELLQGSKELRLIPTRTEAGQLFFAKKRRVPGKAVFSELSFRYSEFPQRPWRLKTPKSFLRGRSLFAIRTSRSRYSSGRTRRSCRRLCSASGACESRNWDKNYWRRHTSFSAAGPRRFATSPVLVAHPD